MQARTAFIQTVPGSHRAIFGNTASFVLGSGTKYAGNIRTARISAGSRSTKSWNVMTRTYVTRDRTGVPVLNIDGFSRPPLPLWLIALICCAIGWVVRRIVVLRHLTRVYRRPNLSMDIANFYDLRSMAWETVWGEHMHHGLYDKLDGKRLRGTAAQVRTMSELLRFGGLWDAKLSAGARVLDVGCGIGGASRFLATHFGEDCQVTGITLSPYQAKRATELNEEKALGGRVKIEVRNALTTGFPDNHFDLVWSMESAEHMESKQLFLKECARILKPGGKMVMLTWCIRESSPPLRVSERFSIRRIMEEYILPRVVPVSEYDTEMIRAGLRGIEVSDWTKRAAPFWKEVARSAAFNPKGWAMLYKYGWPLIRSALAMRHVMAAIKQGVFRLVAFSARKPTAEEAQEEAERAVQCCSKTPLSQER